MKKIELSYLISILIMIVVFLTTLHLGYWDIDFGDYKSQIENILLKGNLINSNSHLIDRYPPMTGLAYGFYFKLFGHSVYSLFAFHLFLNIIIFQFSYKIVFNLIEKYGIEVPRYTPFLLLTIVLNPFIFSFTLRGVNSELIFICLSLVSFYFLLKGDGDKNYSLFIYSFCISLLMLTRIQGLLFCFSTILIFRKNTLYSFRLFTLVFISLIPLIFWHTLMLSYNGKMNFLSSGGLNSFRDGFSFNHKSMRAPMKLPKEVDSLSNEFYRKYYACTEVNFGKSETEFIKNKIVTKPFFMFKVYLFKFFRTFYGVDSQSKFIEKFNIILVSLMNVLLVLFIFINKHRHREYLYFVLSYLFILSLVSAQVLSILRYQVIAFPFLFIYFIVSFINLKPFVFRTK